MRWKLKNQVVDLTEAGMIAGILNVTPDSFSDGGQFVDVAKAVQHAIGMLQEGAAIIDIGGESTRPGSKPVSIERELERVVPVIQALRATSGCLISIDTTKAEVARQAIEAGADIVNDVSGCTADVNMPRVCAETGAGVIVMHSQGIPETMQINPEYYDVVREVRNFFEERYRTLTKLGVNPQSLCFDPGIGFGKKLEHNLQLLRRMSGLVVNDRPIMLGVSRKSMIGTVLGLEDAQDRDAGTAALTASGRMAGIQIHRVHEIRRNYQAMRTVEAVLNSSE